MIATILALVIMGNDGKVAYQSSPQKQQSYFYSPQLDTFQQQNDLNKMMKNQLDEVQRDNDRANEERRHQELLRSIYGR